MTKVCVSGGFDPLHAGHVRLFEAAAKHGELTVIVNSDSWLDAKKGWHWQNWEERAEVIKSCRYVSEVFGALDSDGTVCKTLRLLRPDFFGKSADRTRETTPEVSLCEELGIGMLWDLVPNWKSVGTGKKVSSSDIVKRGWGEYEVLDVAGNTKIKRLKIMPGQSISRQYHNRRAEHWFVESGFGDVTLGKIAAGGEHPLMGVDCIRLRPGVSLDVEPRRIHQVGADPYCILQIIEVQTGDCDEEDIVRQPMVEGS